MRKKRNKRNKMQKEKYGLLSNKAEANEKWD